MNKNKVIATIGAIATLGLGSQVQVNPAPLTVNEWQQTAALYDFEIKQAGGSININNFKDIKDLNDQIRKRPSNEPVVVGDQILNATEYGTFRENLLKKTEKKKIIDVILSN